MKRMNEDAWIKQKALEEDGAFIGAGHFAPASPGSIFAVARKTSCKLLGGESSQPLTLAADTEAPSEVVVLMTRQDQPIARAFYDYQGATLNLEFLRDVPFATFDAEIKFADGNHSKVVQVEIKDHKATLLSRTPLTEDDLVEVRLLPQS